MGPLASVLLGLALAHAVLYSIRHRLRPSRQQVNADPLLQDLGLDVRPLQLRWRTTFFNRTFVRLARCWPRLITLWFALGAVLASFAVMPAMLLLARTLIKALSFSTSVGQVESAPTVISAGEPAGDPEDAILLQPVLPGVNLPLSELGYYFAALLACSAIHEAGHAVAAVAEDVRVLSSGCLLLFILPAAFVDLPTDQLRSLRPWNQLKIFAAGVWHNAVLALACVALALALPTLMSPLYATGLGAHVYAVAEGTAVSGPSGLAEGDNVVDVNGCAVKDTGSWRQCLLQVLRDEPLRICVQKSMLDQHGTAKGENECCDSGSSQTSLCFVQVTSNETQKSHACLPVRSALQGSGGHFCGGLSSCPDATQCYQPLLSGRTRLLRVRRNQTEDDFLFVGDPAEVHHAAHVSDFAPIYSFSPPAWLPKSFILFCHYVASFSAALAVLNTVPCFALDGQHVTSALVDLLLAGHDRTFRAYVSFTFTVAGTALLAANLCVGLAKLT